jgi:hypothetical protein
MALIECKECGKEISDQAQTCPNCGIKLKETLFDKAKDKTGDLTKKAKEQAAKVSKKVVEGTKKVDLDSKAKKIKDIGLEKTSAVKQDLEEGGITKLFKNKIFLVFSGGCCLVLIVLLFLLFSGGSGPPNSFLERPVGLEDRAWEKSLGKLSSKYNMEEIEVAQYVNVKRFVDQVMKESEGKATSKQWIKLQGGSWKCLLGDKNDKVFMISFKPKTLEEGEDDEINVAFIKQAGTPELNLADSEMLGNLYYKIAKKVLDDK